VPVLFVFQVFWIRRRDMHIISVGKNVYTNDERFHILNFEGSPDDWVLQIKYVQKRDNGTYECQVINTIIQKSKFRIWQDI
jgi:hypothetical protein